MSKKYLSLEEAAQMVGVSTGELNRLRERGMIRAFADRGTWKFKEEDVEKLTRTRQADSDPDLPLQESKGDRSTSDLVLADEDALSNQPTIIRKGGEKGSDSDVRLVMDDSVSSDDSSGSSVLPDSDSDVKLASGPGSDKKKKESGSDSDVKLVTDDDSSTHDTSGSDSDVRLVSSDSSGEMKTAGKKPGGNDITLPSFMDEAPKEDATINLEMSPLGDSVLDDESGISLAEGSGVPLASDSGISLERPNDSGISLADDSSLELAHDSGISLADTPSPLGKGKSAADSDDLTGTIPLMDSPGAGDDILDTEMEVPLMQQDDTDFVDVSQGDTTNVITLDDEEEGSDYGATVVRKGGEEGEEETFPSESDEEEAEVADEVLGEDDELEGDVFGAEDEDFGDVESGESLSEMPASARGMAAPVEQEWGAGTFAGLALSAVLMLATGTVLFDVVRNMWHTDQAKQNPVSSMLLDAIKGM